MHTGLACTIRYGLLKLGGYIMNVDIMDSIVGSFEGKKANQLHFQKFPRDFIKLVK